MQGGASWKLERASLILFDVAHMLVGCEICIHKHVEKVHKNLHSDFPGGSTLRMLMLVWLVSDSCKGN